MSFMTDEQRHALTDRPGARLIQDWPIRCVADGRPLAISHDGRKLALATPDRELRVVDLDAPDQPPVVMDFTVRLLCPAFAAHGVLLCGAQTDLAPLLYRWEPGKRPRGRNVERNVLTLDVQGARPATTSVVTGADERWAALVTERIVTPAERVGVLADSPNLVAGTLWVWDLRGGTMLWSEAIDDRETEVTFSPDGKQVKYRNGLRIETRNAITGRWLTRAPLRLDAPGVAFDAAAERVLAIWRPDERPGVPDGLAIVDLSDGAIVHPLRALADGPPRLHPRDISADGLLALALLARPSDTGEVVVGVGVWDVAAGEAIDVIALEPYGPVDARFLPDGGLVVATTGAGLLHFAAVPRTGLSPARPTSGATPGDAPTLGG